MTATTSVPPFGTARYVTTEQAIAILRGKTVHTPPRTVAIIYYRPPPCTGISARWCPACGDCTCPEYDGCPDGHSSETCPLHALRSRHATGEVEP